MFDDYLFLAGGITQFEQLKLNKKVSDMTAPKYY